MENLQSNLAEGDVCRKLLRFSFPLLLSYLLQALYGSIDTYVVSRFSDYANITGVTQGSQITYILTACISGLGSGGMTLISQYAGAKNEKALKETVETVFAVFILFAAAFTLITLPLVPAILQILCVPAEAVPAAKSYLVICIMGTVFVFLYNCISCVLQALGDSRHPLLFVFVACAANTVLDIVLVARFHMGAAGAAAATVAAQCISVVLSAVFLHRKRFIFTFRFRSLRIHKDKFTLLMDLGLPYALQRLIVACSFAAVSGFANSYGLVASSAAGIVSKINTFATLPFSALGTAMTTMCGQNLGAGDYGRTQRTYHTGLAVNLGIGALMFICAQLIPDKLLGLFSDSDALVAAGILFLRFYSIEYLFMPFNYSIHAIMTAGGHTKIPMLDGLLASVLLRVPFCWLFSNLLGFGGVALGSSLAVLGATIPAAVFYATGYWKKPKINAKCAN